MMILAPEALGGRNDRPELGLLVGGGDSVAEDGGGEPALRRQREPLERHVVCCLADAHLKLVDGFLPSSLRCDEPEDDGLVLRYRGKWLESAGALVVVLQEQPLGTDAGEQAPREPLIAALDQPAALLIAATKMKAERNAGTLSEDDVVELEAEVEPTLGRPASALIEVAIS